MSSTPQEPATPGAGARGPEADSPDAALIDSSRPEATSPDAPYVLFAAAEASGDQHAGQFGRRSPRAAARSTPGSVRRARPRARWLRTPRRPHRFRHDDPRVRLEHRSVRADSGALRSRSQRAKAEGGRSRRLARAQLPVRSPCALAVHSGRLLHLPTDLGVGAVAASESASLHRSPHGDPAVRGSTVRGRRASRRSSSGIHWATSSAPYDASRGAQLREALGVDPGELLIGRLPRQSRCRKSLRSRIRFFGLIGATRAVTHR